MGRKLRDVPREPRAARLLTRAVAALVLAAAVALPRTAHADAWSPVTFVGPGGTQARGIASTAVGDSGARLVVGCESGAAAWRGVALLEPAPPPAPTVADTGSGTEIATIFFGRAPVSGPWRSLRTADGVLSWPGSADELRRSLLREDRTRGQATLQLEIRRGATKQRLVFGVGGFAAHGAELAAQCDGWGGDGGYKRRERGW